MLLKVASPPTKDISTEWYGGGGTGRTAGDAYIDVEDEEVGDEGIEYDEEAAQSQNSVEF